jgi:hypothetical protein
VNYRDDRVAGLAAPALLLGIGGGVAAGAYFMFLKRSGEDLPEREETEARTSTPTSESVKQSLSPINAKLAKAAAESGLPLGLLIGWVAKESAGKLGVSPKQKPLKGDTDVERGYFQLAPDESKALKLDHKRLSEDSDYSIAGGIALVKDYADFVKKLDVAEPDTAYFWRVVKLVHTMGRGATKKIVEGAKSAGAASSWETLSQHAVGNNDLYLKKTKHSPRKWFPLVDQVYAIGRPYGFGKDAPAGPPITVSGIVQSYTAEDCEALARAISSLPRLSAEAAEAVAWVCRNRGAATGQSVLALLCPDGTCGPASPGRFLSTRLDPTPASHALAARVLSAPAVSDPTRCATDFWLPDGQNKCKALGDLFRDACERGDAETAMRYRGFADYTEDETAVRVRQAAAGVVPCGKIGPVELLCRASGELVGFVTSVSPDTYNNYVGQVVGNGHCVAFVKEVFGAPPTASWLEGQRVRGADLPAGTPIATFQEGRYWNKTDGNSHAAIYLSQDAGGIRVIDQWKGRPVGERTIRFRSGETTANNDGDAYSVINFG